MVRVQLDEEAIFKIAVELSQPETRAEYLDQVCAEEPTLLNRVQKLLDAHFEAPHYLESELPGIAATFELPTEDSAGEHNDVASFAGSYPAGAQIGLYKLREQLGEGGMGIVYVAEQAKPVRRKVALKIIKPGMASKEVIARFEAERQALAMMEHPHIARIIDAGTTEFGQPFFVMELVHGVPITQYCDEHAMPTRERLQLFVQVCRAVQHAHQKGVIHRDIKPSNVLVADIDGRAVPKVIDFGVAKAVSTKLSDQTVYTQFSHMVGTPLYMSPEQANLGVQDVDTRSDGYSLGVLLYELLTGSTPFERDTLKKLGIDELRRVIREDEPPRPSVMVSTLRGQAFTTVATQRHIDPRKLADSLRGELDWIVMKSLEKDRDRRYEAASALAADVERFLSGDAVQACPPSIIYRVKKYALRNKSRLLAAMVVAALLLIALTVVVNAKLKSDGLLRQLTADVDQSLAVARAAIETGDLEVASQRIGEADRRLTSAGKRPPRLTASVERLSLEIDDRREQQKRFDRFQKLARGVLHDEAFDTQETSHENIPALEEALNVYKVLSEDHWHEHVKDTYLTALQQNEVRETVYQLLLFIADYYVRWPEFRNPRSAQESLDYLRQAALFHEPTRAFYFVRSECHKHLKNTEQMEQDLTLFQSTAATTAFDYYLPGHTAGWRGDLKEAIRSYKAALRIQPDHFNSLFFLAMRLSADGQNAAAAEVYRACLAVRPEHLQALRNRGIILSERGEYEEAIELLGKAIQLKDSLADTYGARGSCYLAQGQPAKALADYDMALDIVSSKNFSDTETAVNVYNHRAELFHRMGQTERALEDLNAAVAMMPEAGGRDAYFYPFINRATLLEEKGEYVKALADIEQAMHIAEVSKVSDSDVANAHLQRGRIYCQTQRKPEAIEDFDKALGLASHQKDEFIREIRCIRGSALFEVNRPQEGVSDLSAVIAMVPKEPTTYWVWAHNQLSWILVTCADPAVRDLPRALELARKAVELEPKNGGSWNTLGVVQYRSGDFTAVITSLNNAVELDSAGNGYPWNALFLAMAQWQLGDHDAARAWYEKGVKWKSDNSSTDEELLHLQTEAEELLGIEPAAPITEKHDSQSPEAVISSENTSQDEPPTSSDLP